MNVGQYDIHSSTGLYIRQCLKDRTRLNDFIARLDKLFRNELPYECVSSSTTSTCTGRDIFSGAGTMPLEMDNHWRGGKYVPQLWSGKHKFLLLCRLADISRVGCIITVLPSASIGDWDFRSAPARSM